MVIGVLRTALPAGSSELTLTELVFEVVLGFDFVSVFVPEAVSVPVSDAVADVVFPAVFKSVADAASVVVAVVFAVSAVCVADAADAVSIVLGQPFECTRDLFPCRVTTYLCLSRLASSR